MRELIEKIEAATEGSRELNAEIAAHPATPDCGIAKGVRLETALRTEEVGFIDIPRYTTSLDAALSLVPEGWSWSINGGGQSWAAVAPTAWAPHFGTEPGDVGGFEANGDTPALALVAACLRAIDAADATRISARR